MNSCSKPCLVALGPRGSFFVRCWKCDDYAWTLSPLVYSPENLEDVFRKYAGVINVCALGANGAYFVQYKSNNSNMLKRVWNLSGYIGEKTEGYVQTRGPLLVSQLCLVQNIRMEGMDSRGMKPCTFPLLELTFDILGLFIESRSPSRILAQMGNWPNHLAWRRPR
jgi:hypothetical protein